MSEADRVLGRKFEISAATPNNSLISLPNILEKPTDPEEHNELEETAEKQEGKATEAQETSPVSQKAEKDPEESREYPEKDCESVEVFLSPESSGDTEVLTFSSSCVVKDQQKISQWEEATDSEEESRPQEGCGDSEDLSCPSSFLSCSSVEHLRQSILRRDRHTSTLNLRSLVNLDYAQDLEASLSGLRLSCSSSTSCVMKGRSRSLSPKSSDGSLGIQLKNSCWPYFRRSDIDGALSVFKQVDEDKNGYISLSELKRFLEILEIPQTHLKAKKMMAQVVRGSEDRLNFGEALIIYGSLKQRMVPLKWRLQTLEKSQFVIIDEVDVAQVGVSGAKRFFEAKIALQAPRYPKETTKSGAEVLKKP